jgi:hypothetical protein
MLDRWPHTRTVAVVTLAVVLVAAAAILRPGTRTYARDGLTFDYPGAWSVHDQLPPSTGLGQAIAILGTLPWGPCAASDINCHYQERLGHDQIEVEVDVVALMATDLCDYATTRPDLAGRGPGDPPVSGTTYVRIDGRPAIRTDFVVNGADYYGSDGWQEWLIAVPGSTAAAYEIRSRWRGPGDAGFLAALDRLVASVRLTSTAYLGGAGAPADCGAPFPAA